VVGAVSWLLLGAVIGVGGAIVGTLAGAELRKRLAEAFGSDMLAASMEDAITIVGALLIVWNMV
jgi:uncharacterized membrane protein